MDTVVYDEITTQVGKKTDTASDTGSLHSKVQHIIYGQLGYADNNRANNTVMGWLQTSIKSWQRVVFTPDSDTYAVTISSVTPAKCHVTLSGSAYKSIKNSENTETGGYAINYYINAFTATSITIKPSLAPSDLTRGTCSLIIVEYY